MPTSMHNDLSKQFDDVPGLCLGRRNLI